MSTPHIKAERGDFAELVLLPGDPLRAEDIAKRFFDDPVQVNAVRNMYGFTGTYKGHRVSVIGSGMGIPSLLIYVTELVREFDVKRIVRVGTCGSVSARLDIGDLFLACGAGTDSSVNRIRFKGYDLGATASFDLLHRAYEEAGRQGIPIQVGNVFSTDLFYSADPDLVELLNEFGYLGVEMESAGLYGLAMREGFQALTVLSASDHLLQQKSISSEARARGPEQALRIVLDGLLPA
ncbi:MAG: purine-nucleoside phosphorylase [Xanthomonadales bacterium]|nr:purine-nucleoside phosphorylase [Xanthomonadales bacterium]